MRNLFVAIILVALVPLGSAIEQEGQYPDTIRVDVIDLETGIAFDCKSPVAPVEVAWLCAVILTESWGSFDTTDPTTDPSTPAPQNYQEGGTTCARMTTPCAGHYERRRTGSNGGALMCDSNNAATASACTTYADRKIKANSLGIVYSSTPGRATNGVVHAALTRPENTNEVYDHRSFWDGKENTSLNCRGSGGIERYGWGLAGNIGIDNRCVGGTLAGYWGVVMSFSDA